MPHVTIVGAGLAGMSAALRLLERDFEVTLYEQDQFVGGMMRAYEDEVTGTRREHSYHMFPNFYFNFWTIAEQLELQDNFVPREAFRFLRSRQLVDLPGVFNPGGPQQFLRNMASYAVPPADLFIYMYSMIDMLAEPEHKADLLHKVSVNGFLRSRPYMTETAADLHQRLWETVWAIASYEASLQSYRTFIRYSNRYSVPQLWLLAGNKYDYLMGPWEEELRKHGRRFQLKTGMELEEVIPDPDSNRIAKLKFREIKRGSPSVTDEDAIERGRLTTVPVLDHEVIIATTPGALSDVVKDDFLKAAPELGQVKYLRAEPMGAMQLYLNKRIENVTDDVTNFEHAPYYMTFLDYTPLWHSQNTFLYVTCSDVIALEGWPEEHRGTDKQLIIDLDDPTSAIELVLREVVKHTPIKLEDVDLRKTAFDMNNGEELFANMVGSWDRRPECKTSLDNLWLAGTYVRNFIDVATVEGAVVSGLQAAEGIRQRHKPQTDAIRIIEPEAFPRELFQAIRVAWAPFVASAKVWSESNKFLGRFGGGWDRWQKKFVQGAAKALQPILGKEPHPPEYLGPLNWSNSAVDLPPDDPRAVGPLFWNYDRDGHRKQSQYAPKTSPVPKPKPKPPGKTAAE